MIPAAPESLPAPLSPAGQVSRLGRLARKELNESLRDRRTILTLVLMPLLLYPLLAIGFRTLMLSNSAEKERPVYRLGFRSEAEARSLKRYLFEELEGRTVPPPYQPLPELRWYDPREPGGGIDLKESVLREEVDVGVQLNPPGPFQADPRHPLRVNVEVLYREDSAVARDCVRYLEWLAADANVRLVGKKLELLGGDQRADPVRLREVPLSVPGAEKAFLASALVPLILILMTMTGAVYPAIDLTAGERERGTLEVLVAAPIPRLSLLLAKYVAVLTVAMLTALVNLGMMALTLHVVGIAQKVLPAGLSVVVLVQVLALLLLFATFFSAVLLTLTSFARSFKEAQAYLIPLMLVALTPGMLALIPGLDLSGPLAVVPLLNIVLLTRDLFAGVASPAVAAVVVATTLLYALAALALAAHVFGTEAVLSNEQSGWGDLLRRPPAPRPVAEPSGALLCLAFMFPAYFLLTSGASMLPGLTAGQLLALTTLANLFLFVGFPSLSAWLGRVRLHSALRWCLPSWQACAAALLLGLCLWPFAHELNLGLRRAGVSTLQPNHLEHLREALREYRALPVVAVVAVLALLPAVLEELFFRGYLFSALLAGAARPGPAVLASSALFALFHLQLGGLLAVERLAPSFLLGLVLGWVCWRTGSVIPGLLLHAAHNGLLVLLFYYEPLLAERGWVHSAEAVLPAPLLLAAAVGAGLGALWLAWPSRGERAPTGEPAS